MATAANNDTVSVHYTGTLNNGSVFDSSKDREPLEFTLGEGRLIPGFEKCVTGMAPGETRTVSILSAEAYGDPRDELIQTVPKDQFPPNVDLKIGQQYQIGQEEDQVMLVTVTELDDKSVTLDANHPLAGEDLNFEIELLNIQ